MGYLKGLHKTYLWGQLIRIFNVKRIPKDYLGDYLRLIHSPKKVT